MGLMQRFMFKFSFFVSVIALLSALFSGVSVTTSVIRASLILLGTMVLFIVLMNVMRWSIITTTVIEYHEKEEEQKKKETASEKTKAIDEKQPEKQLNGINE
jgi:hypothetical protein